MQNILLYILGILVVLLGVALSIGLHELGHLFFAKLFKVKVTKYMIGFGPTLWSRKRGDTEYGVKALPLGGYISMIGMYPPLAGKAAAEGTTSIFESRAKDSKEKEDVENSKDSKQQKNLITSFVEGSREANLESIGNDDARAFYRLSWWKKVLIMLGGPVTNLILGFVFYAILLSGIGLPGYTTTVSSVRECLVAADIDGGSVCDGTVKNGPAFLAGLRAGDKIIELDHNKIENWADFRAAVSHNPGKTVSLVAMRDGKPVELSLNIGVRTVVALENGKPAVDEHGQEKHVVLGIIGVAPESGYTPQPVTAVGEYVWNNVTGVVKTFADLPSRMFHVSKAAFTDEKREADGPVSVVGVGRIAGEITSNDKVEFTGKIATWVGLLAGLNIALFVFNLIPLWPLDGGQMLAAFYEAIKRGIYRLRGKNEPVYADTSKMVPVTVAVSLVLIVMSAILIYADIVKPVTFGG